LLLKNKPNDASNRRISIIVRNAGLDEQEESTAESSAQAKAKAEAKAAASAEPKPKAAEK